MKQTTFDYIKDSIRLVEDNEFAKELKEADEKDATEHIQFLLECSARYEMKNNVTVKAFMCALQMLCTSQELKNDVLNILFGQFTKDADDKLYKNYAAVGIHFKTDPKDTDTVIVCDSHDMKIIFSYHKINDMENIDVVLSNGEYLRQDEKDLLMKDIMLKMVDEKWLPFWEKLISCWQGYSAYALSKTAKED